MSQTLFFWEKIRSIKKCSSAALFTLIIGVEEKRKGGLIAGGQADVDFWVPYRSYQKHNPSDDENFISAMAYPGHGIPPKPNCTLRRSCGSAVRFHMTSLTLSANPVRRKSPINFARLLPASRELIVAVSSIGLLIGGVGVMNIMLMSVTQRTREIGVRKAIGARRRDIIWQFLTEAMALTGFGGLVGVFLGWLISVAARAIYPALPTAVPLWAVMLGVATAMSVGLFFGMYPGRKSRAIGIRSKRCATNNFCAHDSAAPASCRQISYLRLNLRTPRNPAVRSFITMPEQTMTDQEFRNRADSALETLRKRLQQLGDEYNFEVEGDGGRLDLLFEEPEETRFVISPNAPVRQIWISALTTSFKLSWSDATQTFGLEKSGENLGQVMSRILSQQLGQKVIV